MIYGIGTDIVSVERMQESLARWGDRFAERILAATELAEYHASGRKAHFLAKRFAAKEAAAKALGTGFRDGLSLTHISVTHTHLGRPDLAWSAVGRDLITRAGISASHLSLSDERHYAVAYVVLEK